MIQITTNVKSSNAMINENNIHFSINDFNRYINPPKSLVEANYVQSFKDTNAISAIDSYLKLVGKLKAMFCE